MGILISPRGQLQSGRRGFAHWYNLLGRCGGLFQRGLVTLDRMELSLS